MRKTTILTTQIHCAFCEISALREREIVRYAPRNVRDHLAVIVTVVFSTRILGELETDFRNVKEALARLVT